MYLAQLAQIAGSNLVIQILFDEVRPPHHTPPTHHTKKNSQNNGRNGEMLKCRENDDA